jgi:hypothetical protein
VKKMQFSWWGVSEDESCGAGGCCLVYEAAGRSCLMSRTDLRHWKSHRHATLPFKVRMHQPAERLVHLYFKET